MPNLETTYLGLKLKNPVIVGSCTHTINPAKVKELVDAGAGAVVLKSIFEEQIRANVDGAYEALANDTHPEALEYLRANLPMQMGPEKYLERLSEIKDSVDVPVIASVNCTHGEQWIQFAKQVEAKGADALELNIYDIVTDPSQSGSETEEKHLQIVKSVTSELKIPVAVKLSPFYSSLANFAKRLEEAGAAGLVLFNRFLQPDIDPESASLKFSINYSRPQDLLLPLRWAAILSGNSACDISLTTGVHDGEGVAKAILAGAASVQICSVLYQENQKDAITRILAELQSWMDRNGHSSIDDCRGLIQKNSDSGAKGFERAQYVKALVGLE